MPMNPLLRSGYNIAQAARVGLYFGQYWLSARLTKPVRPERPIRGATPNTADILEDLRRLMAKDLANIEAGYYRAPHNLGRDAIEALLGAEAYFRDLPSVERRRHQRVHDEVREQEAAAEGYPRYYLQNFHFQSDGWLSPRSAKLYDHQVEVLFGGGADAMRRQALVPLYEFFKERPSRSARLLDLACGTGRFLTFIKANYPRLDVTALDLSPDYLALAREKLASWRGVEFLQAQAEDTGLPASSFEVVTCVYLFHELPPRIRAAVAAEIARLLKPGGLFVLVDSIQKGDRPEYDGLLDYFPVAFHEPYYSSYVSCDLSRLFRESGLIEESLDVAYFSRLITFRKPLSPTNNTPS